MRINPQVFFCQNEVGVFTQIYPINYNLLCSNKEIMRSFTSNLLRKIIHREVIMYRVGIDLGGTNIKAVLTDEDFNIIHQKSVPTKAERPAAEVIRDMAQEVIELIEENNIPMNEVKGVGIGCPGIVDAKTGLVVYSNNLNWENVALSDEMHKYVNLPIYASNDANCAALGEVKAGAAKGKSDAVMITLGTGVGGGFVVEGKIFEGGGPGGAEYGHTVIVCGGEQCSCGRKGCFEAYSSATALIRDTRRAAQEHPESVINHLVDGDLSKVDGKTPFDAADQGDAVAQAVLDKYYEYLGEGIVNAVNTFRPEVVLLSGGICKQGTRLTDPLNAFVEEHSYAGKRVFIPRVECATLGYNAGLIGAAALVD